MQGRALAVPAGRNAELPLEGSRKRGVGLIADAIGGFADAQALVTQDPGGQEQAPARSADSMMSS